MMILKNLKNIFLVSLILIVAAIPVFIYFIKFNNTSFIGKTLKERVLRSQGLITFLNLNEPGDARYYYSDPNTENILVKVVSVNYEKANESVDAWLKEIISQTLGKNAVVGMLQNIGYPKTKFLTNADLNEIRKDSILLGTADLYLIYAGSYAEKETSVGVVIHRDTIFIFRDAIEALSERGYVKDVLEKTTIMHEWGHLLGLNHFESEDCIMNEMVEVYDRFPLGKGIPTDYCREELQEIKRIR